MTRPHVSPETFIAKQTRPTVPPLLPELTLALTTDTISIWQDAEEAGYWRPFWSFAWPGGQALARHLLDHPQLVAGKRILDVGSGSALIAIAARMAGAASALAADTDVLACAAARENARLNSVTIDVTSDDLLGTVPDVDVLMIGDLFYEPELATRVGRFLEAAHARGTLILYADRTTARRPSLPLDMLCEHLATPCPALVEDHSERARVWQVRTTGRART